MNVAIWGAGSVGTLLGYHLLRGARGGKIASVTLVCRGAEKAAALAHGVSVRDGGANMSNVSTTAYAEGDAAPTWAAQTPASFGAGAGTGTGAFDVVLLTTKAHHTAAAAAQIKESGILRSDGKSIVVGLQNGLGSIENVENSLDGSAQVVMGTTYNGCVLWRDTASGRFTVDHNGLGRTLFGAAPDGEDSVGGRALASVASCLSRAGLPCKVISEEEMCAASWRKLLANCVINPLTVLSREKNGMLAGILVGNESGEGFVDEELAAAWRPLAVSVAAEVCEVAAARLGGTTAAARALGLYVEDEEKGRETEINSRELASRAAERALTVAADTAANTSSMLADIQNATFVGRRRNTTLPATEVAFLNGYIAREGSALGVDAPVNAFLAVAVEAVAMTRATRFDATDDTARQRQTYSK